MALRMKPACERCEIPVSMEGEAWICSYECTFCTPCAESVDRVCPNCGGELVMRPRRKTPDAEDVASRARVASSD